MPLSPICWPPGRQRRYWETMVCASVVFAQTYAILMCSLGGKVGFGFRECARGSWHRRGVGCPGFDPALAGIRGLWDAIRRDGEGWSAREALDRCWAS